MAFLHCARDVFIGDLARQPAAASENNARDGSYIWEARTRYIRLSENSRVGGHEVSSWDFHWIVESE
jgi:hypothetical protein